MARAFRLTCQRCNQPFVASGSRVKFCETCKSTIEYDAKHRCSLCGKIVQKRDQNGRGYECGCHDEFYKKRIGPGVCLSCGQLVEHRNVAGWCLECSKKQLSSLVDLNQLKGICSVCGKMNEHRDQNGRGYECGCHKKQLELHFEMNQFPGICSVCGKLVQKRDRLCRGYECGCHDKFYIEWFENRDLSQNGQNYLFCENCGKMTLHNGTMCTLCHPESKAGGTLPYFVQQDEKLFFLYDGQYVLWTDFVKNWYQLGLEKWSNGVELHDLCEYLFEITGIQPVIQPTFRMQDSIDWSGGARQAFEKDIMDKNVGYFAYIKFYLDENGHSRPLVAGKSGSVLVNSSGSDVMFSDDVEHGPARRFLQEGHFHWDKTNILLLPADSEKHALALERQVQKTMNLFGS